MSETSNNQTSQRSWWAFVILILVLVFLGVAWANSHLQPSSRDAVDFIFGVSGVIVTIIGLVIALWQLQRTTTATVAAAQAVQRLRTDVGMLDVISEIGTCKQEIGSAIDKLNDQNWRSACSHLSPVRSALNRIVAVPGKYPELYQETFKNHISFLIASETELEPINNEEFDSSEMRANLRQIADSLSQLETILREKFGEH